MEEREKERVKKEGPMEVELELLEFCVKTRKEKETLQCFKDLSLSCRRSRHVPLKTRRGGREGGKEGRRKGEIWSL